MGHAKREIERLEAAGDQVLQEFVNVEALYKTYNEDADEYEYERADETKVSAACRNIFGRRKRGEIDAEIDELKGMIDQVVTDYGLGKDD